MKLKWVIIALVALLSAIFFWQTTNRFLYPSKAAPLPTAPYDIESWQEGVYK